MARHAKPVPSQDKPQANHQALAVASQAMTVVSAMDARASHVAQAFTHVGRMQAARLVADIGNRMLVESYIALRDSLARSGAVPVPMPDGSIVECKTMDELAPLTVGKTARRCQQLLKDMETVGADLYEAAETMGFKTRDYQALRALPDVDQAKVKAVIEAGDGEAALDLVHDLAARTKEADERIAELKADGEAKDELIKAKNTKIDKLSSYRPSKDTIARTEAERVLLEEIAKAANAVELAAGRMGAVITDVFEQEMPEAIQGRAIQAMQYLVRYLSETTQAAGLELDVAQQFARPEWLDPNYIAKVNAK